MGTLKKMLQTRDYFFRDPVYQHTSYVKGYVKTYMHNAITLFFLKQGNNKCKIQDSGWRKKDTKGKKHTCRLKLLMI